MGNNSGAISMSQPCGSNRFNELKTRAEFQLENSGSIDEETLLECQSCIRGIIIEGLLDSFFSEYCVYAQSLGITFHKDNAMASIYLRGTKTGLNIDAELCFLNLRNEQELLFVVAHEVKHCLNMHLVKYYDMFKDQVQTVFMNLATDVEVNESLISELSRRKYKQIPHGLITWRVINKIINHDIKESYSPTKRSVSNHVYSCLNYKCKECLGGSFLQLLRKCKLLKLSFTREIFHMAMEGSSPLFTTRDVEEARRFCKELCNFLEYPMELIVVQTSKDNAYVEDENEEATVEGMTQSEVNEILVELEDSFQELNGNISGRVKGRSSHGRSSLADVDFKEKNSRIPWQSALRRFLFDFSNRRESTHRRLNRRMPEKVYLAGQRSKNETYLIVAVDESGSISADEYNYFLSELKSIVKSFDCPMHILEFTSRVESTSFYRRCKKFIYSTSMFKKRSTGGTVAQAVFDYLGVELKSKKRRAVVVVLTDGYVENHVDFKGFNNRLWVITGDYLAVENEKDKNVFNIVEV